MPKTARAPRRRALAIAAAVATLGGAGLALVMADAAGAATPAGPRALTSNTHIHPMAAATGTPGQTRPTTASAASAPAQTRTSTAPSAAAIADPVVALQLAPTQLPAVAAEKWSPVGAPSTRSVTGHDIGENECAKVDGANTWTQQAFAGGDGQNVAIQDTFTFDTAGAARSAYQNVTTGMNACQQTTRALQTTNKVPLDASVTDTASRPEAAAWMRNWTGVMGMSAQGPQTNHFYLAVNGTRLIVLQLTEFPGQAAPYNTAADPLVLAMLDTELAL
jgi:hypothetical protein